MRISKRKLWSDSYNALSRDIDREGHGEYWLKGGRGSGKSSFIARKLVQGLLKHRRANALVCRKVAATLRRSVFAEIMRTLSEMGLSSMCRPGYCPLEITFKTGQRILFMGADDPQKAKSIALERGYFGYLWFEELAEFSGMEDIETIRASVFRGRCDQRPMTFCSYNPPASAASWVNREAIAPRPNRLVSHFTYLDLPRAWIGEAFIAEAEAMRAVNERSYRHMYLGEVTGGGAQVFDNLQLRRIDAEELEGLSAFYNGLDFGFASDPDACTRWAWAPNRRALYAAAEFVSRHTLIDDLASAVGRIAGREAVWCDSAEPRAIAELRQRGLNAQRVRKGPGSVREGIRWLQQQGAIIIDPARTPEIAREFATYEYERDGEGRVLPELPDRDNHTIDSARYALSPLIFRRAAVTGRLD